MLDYRRLQYFLAVAEALHFGRAAEALHISQQPLSRAIAELEEALSVRLFDRTTRVVALTAAGVALREHGQQAMLALTLAERAARSAGKVALKVVYPGTVGDQPHAGIARFKRLHPEVSVRSALVRSWEQEALILRGEADLGFLVPPIDNPRLRSQPLLDVPLVLALPAKDALLRQRQLSFKHLAERTWVLYSPRNKRPLWELVRMCCANAGFSPRRGAEANDESEALAQVAHGAGVALVSKAVPAGREVVFRQLVERPRVTIAAAWRASDDRPELTELVQHLGLFGETRSRRSSR